MTDTTFVREANPVAVLTDALLVWQLGDKPLHAALHKVKDGKILPAKGNLTLDQLRKLNVRLQLVAERTAATMEIAVTPNHVLYSDPNSAFTVWWRPSKPTPQFFDCEELGVIQGVCAMPSLVFAQKGTQLSICAVKGTDRPGDETQVFHAPLFNTYTNTSVCLGDVQLEHVNSYDVLLRNETAFLRGINTHPNGQHRKCLYPDGLFAMWRDLCANPAMGWDDDWLAPCDMPLSNWMKGCLNERA